MRITIIPVDKFISIDGIGILDIQQDLSWIPSDVHAVQWYDDHGEIEYKDKRPNAKITSLGVYEQAIIDHENETKRIKEETERKERERELSRDYLQELRNLRTIKLFNCDWTQFIDSPLSNEKKLEWQTYRQQLRDLPESITDAKSMVLNADHPDWPIAPI
jgi:hypothetical protein